MSEAWQAKAVAPDLAGFLECAIRVKEATQDVDAGLLYGRIDCAYSKDMVLWPSTEGEVDADTLAGIAKAHRCRNRGHWLHVSIKEFLDECAPPRDWLHLGQAVTTPYTSQRVPKADLLAKIASPISELWRRWFSQVDTRIRAIEEALGIQPDQSYVWKVDPATGDMYPEGPAPSNDAGIGTVDNSPLFVAVGGQGAQSVEGYMSGRQDGGNAIVGYRGESPTRNILPTANAPVELAGTALVATAETFLIETSGSSSTDEHYAILSETIVYQGKNYRALLVGPRYVPTLTDSATDTRDIDVTDTTELVVSVTLSNAYPNPDDTSFAYAVRLAERGGRTTLFDIEFFVNAGPPSTPAYSVSTSLNGGSQYYTENITPLLDPLSAGDVVSMYVTGTGTHVQSDGWVEGSVQVSSIEVRQG